MKEVRIPHVGLTDEGFIVLKAQMRILFGVPAEVMPHSRLGLFNALQAALKSAYPLHKWLAANGYEVIRPGAYSEYQPCYVIRQADLETYMWKDMDTKLMQQLDRHVLKALYGKPGV